MPTKRDSEPWLDSGQSAASETASFSSRGATEYEDAVAYYEGLRPGLGERFIAEFDRAVAVTLELPDVGAPVPESPLELGIRRRLLERFSVEIDYMPHEGSLVILAVFHTRRRPGYWKARLRRLR
jgi:toxin ParE1/3/4